MLGRTGRSAGWSASARSAKPVAVGRDGCSGSGFGFLRVGVRGALRGRGALGSMGADGSGAWAARRAGSRHRARSRLRVLASSRLGAGSWRAFLVVSGGCSAGGKGEEREPVGREIGKPGGAWLESGRAATVVQREQGAA
jgi:hypothetical protein